MSDTNVNNKGQVGAMGTHATATGNVFIQQATTDLQQHPLTQAEIETLTKLVQGLATSKDEALAMSEKLAGAGLLQTIVEAGHEPQRQAAAVGGWRTWLKTLGDKAAPVLHVLANIAEIGVGLRVLLGFG